MLKLILMLGGPMRLTRADSPTKKGMPKRLVLGFAALASAAVVGAAGFAGASPDMKPSKAQCDTAGFSNYGQCVKEWAQNKNKPGGGGYAAVNTDVDVNVNGDDNVISVVINYFLN
jgi:hypothetical protein